MSRPDLFDNDVGRLRNQSLIRMIHKHFYIIDPIHFETGCMAFIMESQKLGVRQIPFDETVVKRTAVRIDVTGGNDGRHVRVNRRFGDRRHRLYVPAGTDRVVYIVKGKSRKPGQKCILPLL